MTLIVQAETDINPHFLQVCENIAKRFDFTTHFLTERNTGCISEGRKCVVESKINQDFVNSVRKAG